jgi:sulfate transport system substrate-binding protein
MWSKTIIGLAALAVIGGGAWLVFGSGRGGRPSTELLNVSYDPTRELWRDLNARFIPAYEKETGTRLGIKQSHGGSGTQARAVADGLEADVVTLALWGDTDLLRQKGLLAAGWEERLPNRSLPYTSTIVFVVRKGNPRNVRDWPDLLQDGVKVITPNPKTSGNGKLSFLAAWGAVLRRGGSEREALDFVTRLYRQVPVLDSGARGSTTTFAQKKIGDVHLTWENEAYLEVEEAHGELELVYPPLSIWAEPYVAVVDANVDRKGTRAAAEKYLRFLYTDEAQEIIARHHYRPSNPDVLKKHPELRELDLFPVGTVARDWGEAQQKFFADGGVFDGIYKPEGR